MIHDKFTLHHDPVHFCYLHVASKIAMSISGNGKNPYDAGYPLTLSFLSHLLLLYSISLLKNALCSQRNNFDHPPRGHDLKFAMHALEGLLSPPEFEAAHVLLPPRLGSAVLPACRPIPSAYLSDLGSSRPNPGPSSHRESSLPQPESHFRLCLGQWRSEKGQIHIQGPGESE